MGFHDMRVCVQMMWPARALVRGTERGLAMACVACLLGTGLSGCGTAVKERSVALTTSDRGESWSAVLPSPVVSQEAMIEPGDALYGRRDATLAIRADDPLMGVEASWPEATRPSLDRTRRLNLWRSPESVLYFRSHDVRREYRTYYVR